MLNKSLRFLLVLLIVLSIFVFSACHILDYRYTKSKGETSFTFEDLSTQNRYEIQIKEKANLEFGYSGFEIKEGQLILRIIYKDEIVFEECLTKDSPKKEEYKLKNLEPGEYLLELQIEEAKDGKIKLYWNSSKISY